jgi:hypothetical protein
MAQADRVHSTPPTNTPVPIAGNQQSPVLRVGSLELDLTNRMATRGDRSLDLLPREILPARIYDAPPRPDPDTRHALPRGVATFAGCRG